MRPNARVEDVLHVLSDPEEFVRGILASFIQERFSRDEAVVRIGVSGAGAAPHYCIEQGFVTSALPNLGVQVRGYARRAVFHGRSHKPILEDQFKGVSWSSTTATFAEVQAVLGSLRASRKAH